MYRKKCLCTSVVLMHGKVVFTQMPGLGSTPTTAPWGFRLCPPWHFITFNLPSKGHSKLDYKTDYVEIFFFHGLWRSLLCVEFQWRWRRDFGPDDQLRQVISTSCLRDWHSLSLIHMDIFPQGIIHLPFFSQALLWNSLPAELVKSPHIPEQARMNERINWNGLFQDKLKTTGLRGTM